jgi:hypothetical protein
MVRHNRKNSLFYKTENGASVGDLFMSLIRTCELCGANPFDYLTQLQRHAAELARNPLIATCKRQHIEPFAYLRDLFARISTHPRHQLDDLLPQTSARAAA